MKNNKELYVAAEKGDVEEVKRLVEAGAAINEKHLEGEQLCILHLKMVI